MTPYHIIYYQKRQCTDMYKQLVAGMGMHQYVGKKCLTNDDTHIIYYQKRQCTDMYKQLMAGMGMHQYVGKKCFLMMPISSITKKGNVQSCTNSLYHKFDSVWHFHRPYTPVTLTIEMCSKDGAK
jgi:hypothetical protein